LLCRRFQCCSLQVKPKLFRAFCICFMVLLCGKKYKSATTIAKFESCYHKCLKHFFAYLKYSSVTNMLFELGLPSFDTLLHNYKVSFLQRSRIAGNAERCNSYGNSVRPSVRLSHAGIVPRRMKIMWSSLLGSKNTLVFCHQQWLGATSPST